MGEVEDEDENRRNVQEHMPLSKHLSPESV